MWVDKLVELLAHRLVARNVILAWDHFWSLVTAGEGDRPRAHCLPHQLQRHNVVPALLEHSACCVIVNCSSATAIWHLVTRLQESFVQRAMIMSLEDMSIREHWVREKMDFRSNGCQQDSCAERLIASWKVSWRCC